MTDELVSERGWRSVNEPKLHHVEAEVTRLSGIEKSTSWRATAGFRCAAHRLPKSVRQNARRVLKAAWWAATPLEIPARLRERSHRTQSLLKPEMPAITGLRQVVRRAFDARRDLGSWRNVATRAQQHLAAKGAMGTLSDLAIPPALPYVASLVDGSDARQSPIRRRYNSIRSETTVRLTTKSTSRSVNASGPTISILMPVYKVKLSYLERTIESVLRQAYERWELCIVDDCSNSPAIDMCLQRYAALDPRIKLFQSPTNIGISAATNRALAMATGDFCCLVDHDDLLTNDALDCVAGAVLSTPALDIIYSDECKIGESDEADELYFKPDWDKYLLDNVMFTGHLSTYRTALVRDLGGFRSEYDLSQDYDLALRATERTESIFHIPRILYGWRKHPNSAASGGKPEARLTNIAALQDAANRRGYNARAVALPTANRLVRDRTSFKQSVSIIIPSDNASFIRKSVDSITLSTTFQNYDIIVVTSTKLISALTSDCAFDHRVKFSAYDAAFNFSEKCNVGARASSADILIFYNDDVRVISSDWIECLLDYLALDEVGICGPKLLYENETIQHAGMVTGVRQLVGTAFHSLPRGTPYYYNFAQSVRTTSLICGAC